MRFKSHLRNQRKGKHTLVVCFFFSSARRVGISSPSMTFGEGNGRARTKRLITVFAEAMSRVASRQSRVSQAIGDDTKADGSMKNPISLVKNSEHYKVFLFFFLFACFMLKSEELLIFKQRKRGFFV